jgi:ABC-type sugar transport system substrate-binding protein
LRLLPEGGAVLLILGAHNTPSAVSREKGFREVVGNRLDVQVIEGKWQAERAEEALRDWLAGLRLCNGTEPAAIHSSGQSTLTIASCGKGLLEGAGTARCSLTGFKLFTV